MIPFLPSRCLCLALLVCATALSRPLAAQRADTTARRDSTRRDSLSERRIQGLPPIVVTGSLAPAVSGQLGVARDVISRSALDAEPSRAMVDPLRHTIGVHIDEANGPLGPTIIRLRGGEENYTQTRFDGVQVNENGGFFPADGLTLVNVRRVEVARGPQSSVYGTSAMSGAIQIVTRVGEPGSVRSEATVEGARTSPLGGNRRVTFESEGGTDLLRYSAGLGVAYDRGIYRLPNDLRSNDASVRLDVVPGGGFEVAAIARYMGVNFMLPVRDPGVTRMPLDPDQRNGRDRVVGSLEGTWTPSARWTHKLTLADYHLVFTYDNQDDKLDPSKYPFGFFDANYHYHAVLERLTGRYVGTVTGEPTPSLGFSFSYGGAWERESLHNDASGDFGPSTQAIGRSSIAAFGEGQLRVGDRLSFLTGARAESFHGVGGALVPRVTAVFQVIPGRVALRTAAATGYLAPNIQVQYSDPGFFIGNPDLKPEKSRSVEIGADFTGAFANASLTAFRQHYYNLIRIVPFDSTRQINRNLGSSRALGIEAEGAIHPRGQWVVGAEAAWTTTKMLDNTGLATDIYPDGQPLPFRPTYTASGYTTFPVFSPLSMTLRLSGVGPQIVLSERFSGARVSVAPYQTLGATATWPVSRTLDVYLHAENVLNSTYATAFDKPGAPRSVAAGIRIRQ